MQSEQNATWLRCIICPWILLIFNLIRLIYAHAWQWLSVYLAPETKKKFSKRASETWFFVGNNLSLYAQLKSTMIERRGVHINERPLPHWKPALCKMESCSTNSFVFYWLIARCSYRIISSCRNCFFSSKNAANLRVKSSEGISLVNYFIIGCGNLIFLFGRDRHSFCKVRPISPFSFLTSSRGHWLKFHFSTLLDWIRWLTNWSHFMFK